MDQRRLMEDLHNFQTQKRCLVVVDDIWETEHWDILKPAFPVLGDKCKVVLTTRNENIARQEYHHGLDFLSEDQGWELLRDIAFPRYNATVPETELKPLEDIGRKIVQKCGCLPLAISVIGRVLGQNRTLGDWKRVSENIATYLKHGEGVGNVKRVEQVLELSYNVLPYYLRSCFLYFGCFREDQEIDTERLYLLWMAEGLISFEDKGSKETLRDVAERYLSELASRCMVQVQKDEIFFPYNKFKSCRLHDLMRLLCSSTGEEQKFIKCVDFFRRAKYFPPIDSTVSRLAIHFDGPMDGYLNDGEKLKRLRSLLLLSKKKSRCNISRDYVRFFDRMKFIKILILETCELGGLSSELLGELIHLRYLSLFNSNVYELPLSLRDLQYLQTLDLRVSFTITLPNVICKIKRLKHLFLGDVRVLGKDKLKLEGLEELETLDGFDSSKVHTTDIPRLTNLKYLSAIVHDIDSLSIIVHPMSKNHRQFREVHLIVQDCDFKSEEGSNVLRKVLISQSLVSLEVQNCKGSSMPCYQPGMCTNLVQLSLTDSKIMGDVMEVLGKFPMLRALELNGLKAVLNNNIWFSVEIKCRANSFPQLKFLWLRSLEDFRMWVVDKGAMPNLSTLQIEKCKGLKMVPDGLRFITTLRKLSVDDMPKEFNDRLRVVNGKQGQDYTKVCHIPSINLEDEGFIGRVTRVKVKLKSDEKKISINPQLITCFRYY